MLYSICGLGATRRQFPKEIFTGVRGVINGILRSNDILSDARIENVQALLLLAQVGDLHAQPSAPTASASLIRTGAAIRMVSRSVTWIFECLTYSRDRLKTLVSIENFPTVRNLHKISCSSNSDVESGPHVSSWIDGTVLHSVSL